MAKNTTPALPVWIQDLSIDDIGSQRHSSINVYVHGFWSDVITIYVRREQKYSSSLSHLPYKDHPVEWTFTISHSSGGRDKNEVPDDLEAESNFALGLMAAVQHARLLRSRTDELETAAQRQRYADEERERAEQQAREAATAADEALGALRAGELIAQMASGTTRHKNGQVKAWERGDDKCPTIFEGRCGRDGTLRFFKSGIMLSRKAAHEALAKFSVRSTLEA